MSKETAVIVLGIWLVILPYIGVPSSWKTILLILTGLALFVVGCLLRTEAVSHGSKRKQHHTFVENSSTGDHRSHDHKEGISSLN